jgi:hypothetical protein
MLVYGDVERWEEAAAINVEVSTALRPLATMPSGLRRHAALAGAFLRSSELVVGLLDARFRDRQTDSWGSVAETGTRLLTRFAVLLDRSWQSGFRVGPDARDFDELLGQLPDEKVQTKVAEGYAHYAVYPESYAEAARRSGLSARTRVIGIRSIGLSLAAMVAAGLGAEPPLSVRPIGHPFERKIAVDQELERRIFDGSPPAFAIVDEGPGLSGSSFAAVADWLESRGVPPSAIHFFPSHGGDPGHQASAAHRERWRHAARHLTTFDQLLVDGAPAHRLANWVRDLVGPLDAPLREISGGSWRSLQRTEAGGIPVAPQWERRKFIARRRGSRWLVKFAGLGQEAERKLALAQTLADAGFAPRPLGLLHGFLVEEWVDGVPLVARAVARSALLERLAAYLAVRASFIASPESGAPMSRLVHMAVFNIGEALGTDAASLAARRLHGLEDVTGQVHRIEIDGRLHRWEWIVSGDRLIKTDALDHAHAHDFIGAQDLTWDIAGAVVEHDLSAGETAELVAQLRQRGCLVARDLLQPTILLYLAFQLGAWTMSCGPEAQAARRYRTLLHEQLTSSREL